VETKEVRKYKEFNEKLLRLGRATSSLFSKDILDEVIDETFNILTEILNQKYVSIGEFQEDKLVFIRGTNTGIIGKALSLAEKGITIRTVKTGRPQLVSDTRQDPDYTVLEGGFRLLSEVDVPVFLEGEVKYVLNLESPELNGFSEEEVALIELVAIQMEAALKNGLNKQRLANYATQLHTVSKAMANMNLCDSEEELVELTLDVIKKLVDIPYTSYLKVTSDKLVQISIRGTTVTEMVLDLDGPGITTRAVRTGKPVLVEDTRLEPDYVEGSIYGLSELAVPVLIGAKAVGVINMESGETGFFTERHLKLAQIIAAHLSSNMLRLKMTREASLRDKQKAVMEIEAAKAKEISELRKQFMYTIAHEIRSPITTIKGYSEVLLDLDLPPEALKYLGIIIRNVDRLTMLSNDLLEFLRLENGKMRLSISDVDLKKFINSVTEEMNPLIAEKKQVLKIKLDSSINSAEIDKERITQVLINLLNNAYKYSPEGSTVTLEVVDMGDGFLFSVSDQGVGIRGEDMPRLFKPFPGIRVPGVNDSTGLGLSISKGIVELHGGRIWVESMGPGKGSTFKFTLPKKRQTPQGIGVTVVS